MCSEWQGGFVCEVWVEDGSQACRLLREGVCASGGLAGAVVGVGVRVGLIERKD